MDLQSPRPVTNPRRNPTRRAKNSAKAPDLINPPSAIADITPFPLNEILPLEPPEILLSAQKPAEQYTGPSSIADITPFPLNEILPLEPPQIFLSAQKPVEQDEGSGESLKVFLRIRPLEARNYPAVAGPRSRRKGASPKGGKSKKNNVCLLVNDSGSVTLSAPNSLLDSKRTKSEVYDGFSFVFPQDSLQDFVRGLGPHLDNDLIWSRHTQVSFLVVCALQSMHDVHVDWHANFKGLVLFGWWRLDF